MQQAGLTYLGNKVESAGDEYRGSLEFGKRLAGYGPLFASDPSTQFCLQASRRNLGEFGESAALSEVPHAFFEGAVARCRRRRIVAGEPPGPAAQGGCPVAAPPRRSPPRRQARRALLAGQAPRADRCGQQDRAQSAPKIGSHTTRSTSTSPCMQHRPDARAARKETQTRQRPGPFRPRQHSCSISTATTPLTFHLQINHAGCLHEDCWGDAKWDAWFVAVDSNMTDCWQIEAAVPLTELTADRPRRHCLGRQCHRILSGRGVQAFSLPADLQPRPEGMGLMLFDSLK